MLSEGVSWTQMKKPSCRDRARKKQDEGWRGVVVLAVGFLIIKCPGWFPSTVLRWSPSLCGLG